MTNPVVEISREDVKTLMAKLEAATRDTAVISGMTDGAVHMQDWIKSEKLTNGPLFVGKGTLRESIVASPVEKSGDTYQGKIGVANTKAKVYAHVHEYGMTIHAKNAPYLMFKVQTGNRIFTTRGGSMRRLKKPVGLYSWVRVKSVTIPARPFMRPAAEEPSNLDYLVKSISEKLTAEIVKAN
jgi:phage gpG-like protein